MAIKKRTTIYCDAVILRVLKIQAKEFKKSVSEIVNEVLRNEIEEDREDLEAVAACEHEPTISLETLRRRLKLR